MPRQPIAERFYRSVVDALSRDRLVLPTLPEIALRIAQMVRNPDVSMPRLAAEIAKDPAISVRLLRVANSAVHGAAQRADSVPAAVTRLGLQLTRLLVSGLAVEQLFCSGSVTLNERLRRCWAESVEVGALAQVLAARCTRLQPEMAMLAGLVHQVGVLPILRLGEAQPELCDEPGVLDWVIGQLAPRIGRMVLQAWAFSAELCEVPIACREHARRHDGAADYADVVILASLHQARGAPVDRTAVSAFARLNLSPDADLVAQLDAAAMLEEQRALLAA